MTALREGQHDHGQEHGREPAGGGQRLRAVLLAVLGCVLMWQIATRSLVAYVAEVSPRIALAFAPEGPTPLLRAAERELAPLREQRIKELEAIAAAAREAAIAAARGGPAQDSPGSRPSSRAIRPSEATDDAEEAAAQSNGAEILARIEARTREALAQAPLSASGLRILGEVADLRGDRATASRLMTVAARRWHHETHAVYRAMVDRLEAGDLAGTVEHADTLLRASPELWLAVAPALVVVVESGEEGARLVVAKLSGQPVWRHNFMGAMLNTITDARTPLTVLLGLKDTRSPPTKSELTIYLNFLVSRGFYEIAYYTWLQFLPPERLAEIGHLYNGSFAYPLTGMPLDWVLRDGSGAMVEVVAHGEGSDDHGLRVELGPGRVQFGQAQQWLVLGAGPYRLTGSWRGDINGRRGMRWRIYCIDNGERVVGETQMLLGQQRTWREFELAFEIPDEGCRAQQLRLVHDSRHASEQFVTGVGWFDNLSISRRR